MSAPHSYWALVRSALAAERARASALTGATETAFLPAALEIVEQPVSPTARTVARVALAGLLLIIGMLIFVHVDVVTSAPGVLAPSGEVKLVQSQVNGSASAILVEEGQRVKAGQALVRLDPTNAAADANQAAEALSRAQWDSARWAAVLGALDGGPLRLVSPPGSPPTIKAAQTALARGELATVRAAEANKVARRTATLAGLAEARAQLAKLDETLPLLDRQITVYEELLAKGFVAKMKVLDLRRQRLAAEKDRDMARAEVAKAQADVTAASEEGSQASSDARSTILEHLVAARSELEIRAQESVKARENARMQLLSSPVDGIVAELQAHTVGGLVEAGKPLMMIVPMGARLNAEIRISDRDIGSAKVGQEVRLKLAAYPFSRFGTLPGRVRSIAANAVTDARGETYFRARVTLSGAPVARNGQTLVLLPGMQLVADVTTARRTLMSYLISPLRATANEALRER